MALCPVKDKQHDAWTDPLNTIIRTQDFEKLLANVLDLHHPQGNLNTSWTAGIILQNQPDLDFLDILIRDGIKHGVVFQIKHFVYPATPPNHHILVQASH